MFDFQVAMIRKRYAEGGVTQAELAKELGLTRSAIGYLLRGDTHPLAGGPRRCRRRLTSAQVAEIRARYADGAVTYGQLAAEFGVDRSTVGYVVRGGE